MIFVRKKYGSNAYPDIEKGRVYVIDKFMANYYVLEGSKRRYDKNEFVVCDEKGKKIEFA